MMERIEINLLPAEYRIYKRNLKLPRSIVYPVVAVLILAFAAISVSFYTQNLASSIEDEIAAIERDIAANKNVQAEINKLRKEKKEVEEKILALERINVNRELWVRLMEVLSGGLPPHSWLMSIREEAGPPPVLSVEARTYSFHEVASYMSRLGESEFINKVELHDIERVQLNNRNIYRFSISCTVNPDAKLDISRGEERTDG
ncbi:MAG: PilN domain-containing protein [Chitinispirillales bacterium]|jgi:Tfp pilus assembly protein PilN|nr:PilN domain-containing protein [Chitinispirillales bacterium]